MTGLNDNAPRPRIGRPCIARRTTWRCSRLTYALGVLGMPGLTAYAGLGNIGRPQAGETVAVAEASGAVGSVVGQTGRIGNCRFVAIVVGAAKYDYVKGELGFDEWRGRAEVS